MGISIIVLLIVIVFFSMFFNGVILVARKRWKLAMVFMTPPILIGLLIIGAILYVSHTTNPNSIVVSIEQDSTQDHRYYLSGKWKERIDYYSYGTDFIAVCTKENKKVEMIDYVKGDWKPNYYSFGSNIPYQIKRNTDMPQGCKPQLFDIKVQKEFLLTFKIENQVWREPIEAYYVHVRIDPMDSPTFWVKSISFE